jgi:hypothetical protein
LAWPFAFACPFTLSSGAWPVASPFAWLLALPSI